MQKTLALMLFALVAGRHPDGSGNLLSSPPPSENGPKQGVIAGSGFDAFATFRLRQWRGAATENLLAVTNDMTLSVFIDGDAPGVPIMEGEWTWTADVLSGGTPPYTYTWERRSFCDNDFQLVGTDASYVEDTEDGEDPFYIRLTVTDANLQQGSSTRHFGGFIECP